VVFQRCFSYLLAQIAIKITTYHLFYTKKNSLQCITIVKVHGVFPSSRKLFASSRTIQFHWAYVGDSGAVVTPFMQDTN